MPSSVTQDCTLSTMPSSRVTSRPRPSPISGGSAPSPSPCANDTDESGLPARLPRAVEVGAGVARTARRDERVHPAGTPRRQLGGGGGSRTPRHPRAGQAGLVSGVQRARREHDEFAVADRTLAGQVAKHHGAARRRREADAFRRRIRRSQARDLLVVDAEQFTLGDPRRQRVLHRGQCGFRDGRRDVQAGDLLGRLDPSRSGQHRRRRRPIQRS